ncbi:hypothetical protein N7456_010936 [Penicillium angulare]|uniref:Uncharacterized protein n=1 Tax=Penicillium angulare TaxID=116970 RepID=A0A9W9ET37_9EURO|nr:hypothetical protein N7456_010936 [Penicillium angulare]
MSEIDVEFWGGPAITYKIYTPAKKIDLKPGHPLFNRSYVPPVLAPIEETPDNVMSMREFTLFKEDIKQHTNILTEDMLSGKLNAIRRCRCCLESGTSHSQRIASDKYKNALVFEAFCECSINLIFEHEMTVTDIGQWGHLKVPYHSDAFNRILKIYLSDAKRPETEPWRRDQAKIIEMITKKENQLKAPAIELFQFHLWVRVVRKGVEKRVFQIYQIPDEVWEKALHPTSFPLTPHCAWHYGTIVKNGYLYAEGCIPQWKHEMISIHRGWSIGWEDEDGNWQTSDDKELRIPADHLRKTPDLAPNARSAVVLTIASAKNYLGDAEVIRVTALDYYSGEILIDSMVSPLEHLLHTDPRSSGIRDTSTLDYCEKTGEIFEHRHHARNTLQTFVGPQTSLIVHNGRPLLWQLRWAHGRIVDTFELEKRRTGKPAPRDLSALAFRLLKRRIGVERNDNIENAFALRDCLHWYAQNMPDAHRKLTYPAELLHGFHVRYKGSEDTVLFYRSWHHEWRFFARIDVEVVFAEKIPSNEYPVYDSDDYDDYDE